MKKVGKKITTLLQVISLALLTTMPALADPIGGYAHNANKTKSSIAWDSPMGITILASIAVFLLVIFLVVFWAWKKGKLRIKKR